MKVELHLPDTVWAKALQVAEEQRTTVARVIEAAVRDAVRPSHMQKLEVIARQNHIVQLVGEGLTDAVIAERTGELKAYVGQVRRRHHLPANQVRRATGTNRRRTA